MHKIEIHQDRQDGYGTTVKVDDKYLSGIYGASYNVSVDEVPRVFLEVVPEAVNIDAIAQTGLTIGIDSVNDAIKCIQFEMKLNKDFRDSVTASASSALTEYGISEEVSMDMAKALIDRIFFGDT